MSDLPPDLARKTDRLLDLLRGYGSCAVAFSGGLDSSVLAKAARLALGDRAVALTGASASMAAGELDEASSLPGKSASATRASPPTRCPCPPIRPTSPTAATTAKWRCSLRWKRLPRAAAPRWWPTAATRTTRGTTGRGCALRGAERPQPVGRVWFYQGGASPAGRALGLPVADKPATPCLSSRIAYGQQVTPERLRMIDRAEQFLRERGFRPLRVRYHAGDLARIEVPADQLPRLMRNGATPRAGRASPLLGLQVRRARSGGLPQREHERGADGRDPLTRLSHRRRGIKNSVPLLGTSSAWRQIGSLALLVPSSGTRWCVCVFDCVCD